MGTRNPEPSFHEAVLFILQFQDFHKPVIDTFGWYSCRNSIRDKTSIGEEREWSEKTYHWVEASSDVAKGVQEDAAAG